jgi:hypothetical protein
MTDQKISELIVDTEARPQETEMIQWGNMASGGE